MNGAADEYEAVGVSDLALGLTNKLDRFKQRVPEALDYRDLGLDPFAVSTFAHRILAEIEAAHRIHFDLTGMNCLNGPEGVLTGPTEWNGPGSTNWELRTIWDDGRLRTKTTFYKRGRVLTERRVLQLP